MSVGRGYSSCLRFRMALYLTWHYIVISVYTAHISFFHRMLCHIGLFNIYFSSNLGYSIWVFNRSMSQLNLNKSLMFTRRPIATIAVCCNTWTERKSLLPVKKKTIFQNIDTRRLRFLNSQPVYWVRFNKSSAMRHLAYKSLHGWCCPCYKKK